MQRNFFRHLAWLLVFSFASCATAVDPRQQSGKIILLSPDGAVSNSHGVPRLHERVPSDVADIAFELPEDSADQWIITSKEKETSVRITIKPGPSIAEDRLIATAWDWDNRPVAQEICSSSNAHDLNITVKGHGVYLLTLDGYRKGEHAYRLARSFAIARDQASRQAQWKQSDFWLGICAFPGRYHWNSNGKPTKPEAISEEKAREIEAEAMAKLGLTVARLDVSMALPENEKTPIDWKRMDAAVDAYTSRGFELALQVMHPPDWAMEEKYKSETKDRWRFPRREEPYRRYVREIINRYGKHAKFVQVYNEPDQPEFWAASQEEFITEFDRARDEIRKALPTIPITNGGYAFIDPKRTEYFTQHLKGKIDLAAYHSHGNLRELKRDIDHMRQLHQQAGYDKPRYINTECGFAAWRLDQERTQAASVVQKVLYSWARGDEGMLLFASRMTKAPGRSGRDFGFLDYDFCPRFVYGTVSAMVEQLAGARFEGVLAETESLHAYVFKRGDQRIVAYFSIGDTTPLNMRADAKGITAYDAMGNITGPVSDGEGNIRVTAGALVKYVVVDDATRIDWVK